MSEEKEGTSAGPSGAGVATALALGAVRRESAEAYLEKQSRLTALQVENLEREEPYQMSHLRWRRFEDQMKGAARIMLVGLAALFVIALGTTLWNASRAQGLVVDAFTVPPALEATGLTGNVIAEEITARMDAIRTLAASNSLNTVAQVSRDGGNEIRVEIPQTGISLAEGWRFLKSWLGNERHLRGSLRPDGEGRIRLSIAMDGMSSASFTGGTAELGNLEQQAAEYVFSAADPLTQMLFLTYSGRYDEALAFVAAKARSAATRADVFLYNGIWSEFARIINGEIEQPLRMSEITRAAQPTWFGGYLTALRAHRNAGHEEALIPHARTLLRLKEKDQPAAFQGRGFALIQREARLALDLVSGDYDAYARDAAKGGGNYSFVMGERAFAAAGMHDVSGSRTLVAQAGVGYEGASSYAIETAAGDGKAALRELEAAARSAEASKFSGPGNKAVGQRLYFQPRRAEAMALSGDLNAAEKLIAPTPLDCDYCVRIRGRIATARRDWPNAARWFALVSVRSPHVPFADTEWGRMLRAKGDLDDAIAKFESAHVKGPHYADPLQYWGEALMAKNQSHLALAKFAEADKYAPNWGRLHLKWGEALVYVGKKDEAKKQFVVAARLHLTPSEKSALARMK